MNLQVLGEGPKDCKIAFVGEAPAREEVKLGRPFVGTVGEEFDRRLLSARIVRSLCYITNMLKEQVPFKGGSSDYSSYIDFGKKGYPRTVRYTEYEEYLKEELRGVSANVIVPIGKLACYALTGRAEITKLRGSILKGLDGRKTIPIVHPGAIRKLYLYSYYVTRDLKKILRESESPDIVLPNRHIIIEPKYIEVMDYLRSCRNKDLLTIDIEVLGAEISRMGVSRAVDDAISISFSRGDRDLFLPEEELNIWKELTALLEDLDIVKRGQNITFDATYLLQKYGIRVRNMEDTMVAQGLLYPDFPKSLEFITAWYTDEPYYKDERKKYSNIGGSEEAFSIYNGKDCCVCHEAFPKIMADLDELGNIETYKRQARMIEPAVYMQARGIKVDTAGLQRESEKAKVKIEELQQEFWDLCGEQLNPKSPKQMADYFYVKKGHKPYTDKGKVTTDVTAMKRLARKGVKEANILLQIRKWVKLKGTYFDMVVDSDGRLRSSFNPIGSKYGRFSSSKTIFDTGTDFQNQPESVRKFFLADDDCLMYSKDLDQGENRIVAYISPEPSMIEAFENGEDIHRKTAGLVLDKPANEVSDTDGSYPLGDEDWSERFMGKKTNHAFNYGWGYRKFALKCGLKEGVGKMLKETYFIHYPGVRQYHLWIEDLLYKSRKLVNCFGRVYFFLNRGDELLTDALAFIPQSTVADIINSRGMEPIYYDQQKYFGVDLLNQVHDEILFQIPLRYGLKYHAECLLDITRSLEQPIKWKQKEFVIPTSTSVGIKWGKENMRKLDVSVGDSINTVVGKIEGVI